MKIFDPSGVLQINRGQIVGRVQPAHIGSSIAVVEYIANSVNGTALTTGTPGANTLFALPFVAPARGGVLDRIAAEVTTGSSGNNIRIGLYENKADHRDVYPGALLDDSGNLLATATGIKSHAISRQLVPGRVYWLTLNSSAAIACRCLAVGGISAFLGMADNATTALNLAIVKTSQTFGAMPDPFPSGGAYVTAVPVPVLRYRFSG